MKARVALWDAINRYAQACGGDTSDATVSPARMDAVAALERALEAVTVEAAAGKAPIVRLTKRSQIGYRWTREGEESRETWGTVPSVLRHHFHLVNRLHGARWSFEFRHKGRAILTPFSKWFSALDAHGETVVSVDDGAEMKRDNQT